MKQDVKSAITPTAESAQHKHAMGKEKRVVATVDIDDVQRVEVIGGEYYFDPNYIVVKVNKPVELMVKKASRYISHNMELKSPECARDAALPVSGMVRIPDPA